MIVQILIDNKTSWILPYALKLDEQIRQKGHVSRIIHDPAEVEAGDILCLLACERIFKRLDLNKHNLVVHESALPIGKGWSPLTWQVLEGKNKIPVTLFEAAEKIDAGVIYLQKHLSLCGYELIDELRELQGMATVDLILAFIDRYPNMTGTEQVGVSTYYPKRTTKDSALDPDKSIREQFNLLRVVDNERYPAYFVIDNVQYTLMISKA